MPRQKSKVEGYNLVRELIGIRRSGNVITPLEDDEGIFLSGKELREFAEQTEEDIKIRNGLHTETKKYYGYIKKDEDIF